MSQSEGGFPLLLFASSFSPITLIYCVYVYVWRSEDNLWGQFSPSTNWGPGLVASELTHSAVSRAEAGSLSLAQSSQVQLDCSVAAVSEPCDHRQATVPTWYLCGL